MTTVTKQLTVKEAANRLKWQFSQGKAFKPNQTDVDALNILLKTISQNAKKAVQGDRLFAKLYLVLMNDFVIHYGDVNMAHKQINKLLSRVSVEQRCQMLCDTLNIVEVAQFAKQKGFMGVLDANTKAEVKSAIENDKVVYQLIDKQELLETLETWDLENVVANANSSISLALNNYKDLP